MYPCSSLWPSDLFVCPRHPYLVGKLGSAIVIISRVYCFCFCVEEFVRFVYFVFLSCITPYPSATQCTYDSSLSLFAVFFWVIVQGWSLYDLTIRRNQFLSKKVGGEGISRAIPTHRQRFLWGMEVFVYLVSRFIFSFGCDSVASCGFFFFFFLLCRL
jgi:hypothetical protein